MPAHRVVLLVLALLLLRSPGAAAQATSPTPLQSTPPSPLQPSDLEALRWRELGPAITSGRITAFAVDPRDTDVIFTASASGGAWKTVNGGTTWDPVFESERTVSLGSIALAPSDPDVVWLGTGEQNSVRSSSFGDGVYRSLDGGLTWEHRGLDDSRHVGRIVVHPDDADVVFVAAMGSLWGPGPERGLYRTRDGGDTWQRVLEVDEYTGVVEVVMDPRDPDVLFAATFQRERRQWSMVGGGPGSGLFRSGDGGDSWERVEGGFPTEPLGRIGITSCAGDPDTMYASAVGPTGGIFRSDDAGATWERRNARVQSHWFYGELVCDPADVDRLYVPMTPLQVSDDGGRTFRNLVRTAVHVDHHTLWVNPDDPTQLMVGNDGGVYISRDRGEQWSWQQNLPVMQLYTAGFDLQEPFYHVYGGTQDNGSWGGPVGTRFSDGVANEDWLYTAGGDGFFSRVDPADPDIVYAESQYGGLSRLNRATGERRRIQPWQPQDPDAEPWRWNWSAPLEISPHDPATLYFAANVVFRSRDRGDSWTVISPDLSRGLSRDSLPLQGRIQPPDAIDLHASTALYGNVATLAVSPLEPGVVAVGTDDGLIQVTRDDGGDWQRTAAFPDVPDQMKVSGVAWSATAPGTLFAVFDGHKDDDFRPHVVRSDDHGATWRNVTGDLPSFGPTRSVAVHPRNGDLVFVGTEFGLFFSNQGGDTWLPLDHDLPTVAVHAIAVHPRENDLVLGTHGRGFQVLDDLGLLEALTPEVVASHSLLAQPRRATQIRSANRGRGSVGDSRWTADNPPRGAILDAWFGDAAVGEPFTLDVLAADGSVLRRVAEGTAARGAHRRLWDLRHEAPLGADGQPSRRSRGRFVIPGSYTVRLTVGEEVHTRTLDVRMDPGLSVDGETRRALDETLSLQAALVGAVAISGAVVDTLRTHVDAATALLQATASAPAELSEATRRAEAEVRRLEIVLNGPGATGLAQQETVLPLASLVSRLYSSTESWTGPPTADQRQLTARAHRDVAALLGALRGLLDGAFPALRRSLASAGLRWPGGAAPTLPSDLVPPPQP